MRRERSRQSLLFPLCLGFTIVVACGTAGWIALHSKVDLPHALAEPVPIQTENTLAQPVEDSPPAPAAFCLEGSVFDETGQNYAGAIVTITSTQPSGELLQTNPTDSFGRCRIDLACGRYICEATAPDAIVAAAKVIEVGESGKYTAVFSLPRSRILAGRVYGESSQPAAGVNISLHAIRANAGLTASPSDPDRAEESYTAISSSTGSYSFPAIWPGEYQLAATASGYLPHIESSVRAGQTEHAIVLRTKASIVARVAGGSGVPVFLASVNLQSLDPGNAVIMNAESSQEGVCTFAGLGTGRYRLSASHKDFLPTEQSESIIELECSRQVCKLVLESKGFTASGRVLDINSKKPVPGFTLHLLKLHDEFSREIIATVTSGALGEFAYTSIQPDAYRIAERTMASPDDNKDSPCSMLSTYPDQFAVVVRDSDVTGLEVWVTAHASISGHIYDLHGNRVEGAVVSAYKGGKTQSAADGSYTVAFLRSYEEDWMQRTFVEAEHPDYGYGSTGEKKGIPYEVGEKIENIDIILKYLVDVSGTVANQEGEPLLDADVKYVCKGNDYRKIEIPVDGDGKFEIHNAPTSGFGLHVSAPGYILQRRICDHKGKTGDVREDFILIREGEEEETLEIRGMVVDRNGNPISDVTVESVPMMPRPKPPQGYREAVTDSLGRFVLDELRENETYRVHAKTERAPYYERTSFNIPSGTEHLLIQFDFEPVELVLHLDESSLADRTSDGYRLLKIYRTGDRTEPAIAKGLYMTGDVLMQEPLMLSSPGEYTLSIEQLRGKQQSNGSLAFTIGETTPRQLHLTVRLLPAEIENMFYVAGRCLTPGGEVVKDNYRVYCRLLDPSPAPVEHERGVQKDPSPYAGFVTFILLRDGTYEFNYVRADGVIFHRIVTELKRSMGVPWPDGTMPIPGVSLPDAIYPDVYRKESPVREKDGVQKPWSLIAHSRTKHRLE